jgi:toxin ParE1/3/4
MRKLVYRPTALADLDGIYDFIAPENPRRAAGFVDDIRQRCRTLCTHPELGPARADLASGIRIYPMLGRIVVAYRVAEDAVVITRVFSGGQDYEAILRKEDAV